MLQAAMRDELAAAEVACVREVLCGYAVQCGVNLSAPPDDAIFLQVLKLGDSHRLNPAIRAMFDARRRPARSWAFFPTVLPQFLLQVSHGQQLLIRSSVAPKAHLSLPGVLRREPRDAQWWAEE